jgi:hypothetical protein
VLTAREQPAVDQIQGYFLDYYALSSVPRRTGWTRPDSSDITSHSSAS